MPGVCDSCGDEVDDLVALHRIYVVPTGEGGEVRAERTRDIEHWCYPCRTHYPHELIIAD